MTKADDRKQTGIDRSRNDRARSLEALHSVEKHAGAAGPARPNEIRELRAWETDIVYDGYAVDLGIGD